MPFLPSFMAYVTFPAISIVISVNTAPEPSAASTMVLPSLSVARKLISLLIVSMRVPNRDDVAVGVQHHAQTVSGFDDGLPSSSVAWKFPFPLVSTTFP